MFAEMEIVAAKLYVGTGTYCSGLISAGCKAGVAWNSENALAKTNVCVKRRKHCRCCWFSTSTMQSDDEFCEKDNLFRFRVQAVLYQSRCVVRFFCFTMLAFFSIS